MTGRSPTPSPKRRSRIRFPSELPISARVPDIVAALSQHQVVIVAGSTGSGKTTQLPKVALKMGRGGEALIGVTQPRRIAATSVAARVASELECELGAEVGYQIRFEDRTSADTWVKFMTDGVLLAEIQGDRLLRRYDTLIIDEAHERSLNIDFILGWLKRILPERRDLKVVISSATIETGRFAEFFDDAPVIQVEGRTYPVDVLYEPPASELDLPDAVADAVVNVTSLDPHGDILVFLPGEREIREAEQALATRQLRHTTVQPLYSRLSASDQAKVFSSLPQRRVILATNVAETSLTIPGIVYVIDTGVARLSRYDARTGTTRLQIEAISQASADQRKGRCGRMRDGICVRLFDEESFNARPAFTDPEMKRTGMAAVILRMKSLDLGDVEQFPFLDPPHARSIAEGYRVLQELGALDDDRALTQLGARLARFPVDPRVSRMIVAGAEFGCLEEVLIVAAALNIQDPRERPRGLESKADQLHRPFRDEHSDFAGLLRLWAFVCEQANRGSSQLRRACKDNFLSFNRIREWRELYLQLGDIVGELKIGVPAARHRSAPAPGKGSAGEALHWALLSGLLSKIGQWNPEQRIYLGARQTRFALHPSSGLAKKPPAWVMAFELVQTTQLFARTAAKLDPLWFDRVAGHLMKRSYSDPHWSERSGRASVKEHATLFGLPVLKDRSVDYATIAPEAARTMFIEHALVRGEYKSRGAFQDHNRQLLEEIARLRDKARQSDMLASDEQMLVFFEQRVPSEVVNGKSFETWREDAEKSAPNHLRLSLADVLGHEHLLSPELYPDSVTLHGVRLDLCYRFDPTLPDDGVTIIVPLALVPQLEIGELDWTIPAWQERKLAALLYDLPRPIRREIGAIPELATSLAARLVPFSGPLLPALTRAILELTGAVVPEEAIRPDTIADYLRLNCRIVGEQGRMLAESRNADTLLHQHGGKARALVRSAAAPSTWERVGMTGWACGELPPFVTREILGAAVRGYPALLDRGKSVDLTLVESETMAETEHRAGVQRLIFLAASSQISVLAKRIPAPFTRRPGLLVTTAERDAFRELVLLRVIEAAFELSFASALPRSKAQFERLLALGLPRLGSVFEPINAVFAMVGAEHENTLRAVQNASKHPSGAVVTADIRSQLDQLFSSELLTRVPLPQLQHYPRYLRAVRIRLDRAVVDPRKDAAKAEPLVPLCKALRGKAETVQDQPSFDRVLWATEELRVALFAPELKPAQAITLAGLTQAIAALR
jgi:ATP-dependent helicase HrpA